MEKFFNPFGGASGSGGGGGGGTLPDRYIEIAAVDAYGRPTEAKFFGVAGDTIPSVNWSSSLEKIEMNDEYTKMDGYQFQSYNNLVEVKFSKNITNIPQYCFYGCSAITTINLPNNLTSVSDYAFRRCSSLTTVNFPSSLDSIGIFAFNETNIGAGGTFTMPDIQHYGDNAFDNIKATKIIVPEGVTEFHANELFRNCPNVVEIVLPSTLTKINTGTFRECRSLTAVNIPSNVTTIGEHAFQDCASLSSATIPNSVTLIDRDVFNDCPALTSVEIPGSVTQIKGYAFAYDRGLTEVTLNEGLERIGDYCFRNCENLTSIKIPNSVKVIEERGFLFNYKLVDVDLGSGVEILGAYSFEQIAATQFVFPASVKKVETATLQNCRNMENIYFMGTPEEIQYSAMNTDSSPVDVYVPWSEGDIGNAPWGLPSGSTIHYDCDPTDYPIS